jgi:hypothetical protein
MWLENWPALGFGVLLPGARERCCENNKTNLESITIQTVPSDVGTYRGGN